MPAGAAGLIALKRRCHKSARNSPLAAASDNAPRGDRFRGEFAAASLKLALLPGAERVSSCFRGEFAAAFIQTISTNGESLSVHLDITWNGAEYDPSP